MTDGTQGLSFVVPVFNEESGIVETLTRLKTVLSGLAIPWEILLVDDGSTDRTRELAAQVEGVTIVAHPVNIGYGNSLKTGIRRARHEWVGIVDGDGSYPIEDVPLLVKEMQNGFDMVVGTRSNIDQIDGFVKRWFRRIFKRIVAILNNRKIEDPNSGFRIFRKPIILKLMPFLCGTFSFTTSLTILASGMFYFVKYVPVQYSPRTGKSKVLHVRDTIRTAQYIAQGIIFFNPIKFFLLLGMSTIVFVCIPAMFFALFRMFDLSKYYMIFGMTVAVMIAMGGLGDIIRISTELNRKGNDDGLNC